MSNVIPPDAYVLIIGAQKAATTTLFNLLAEHPAICPAKRKEPKYFIEERSAPYETLFEYNPEVHERCLEGSTAYTMFPDITGVPKRIKEYGLEPYFLYSVRNPFDRIESEHRFGKVQNAPWKKEEIVNLGAIHRSMYYLQVREYIRYYSKKDNYLIVDFDDIASSPVGLAKKIFDWIGVEAYEVDPPGVVNETPSSAESKIADLPIHWGGALPDGLRRRVKRFLRQNESRPSLSSSERKKLRKWMRRDMERFEEAFDFPIGKWGF